MKTKRKKLDVKRIITKFVFASFVIPLGFIIYKIVVSPTTNPEHIANIKVKTDYVLMLIQCILGIVALFIPSMISKKARIVIPSNMYVVYVIFLYAAIFLGEVRDFYYKIPHWDTILHTFSGAGIGALGFSVVSLLNKEKKIDFNLSPFFVALFSFCFAVTIGVFWEIYEFSFDGILGLNMQKFALENGSRLLGRAALMDTMKDLIVDSLGAFIMSVLGYISIKFKKGWLDKILITEKKLIMINFFFNTFFCFLFVPILLSQLCLELGILLKQLTSLKNYLHHLKSLISILLNPQRYYLIVPTSIL